MGVSGVGACALPSQRPALLASSAAVKDEDEEEVQVCDSPTTASGPPPHDDPSRPALLLKSECDGGAPQTEPAVPPEGPAQAPALKPEPRSTAPAPAPRGVKPEDGVPPEDTAGAPAPKPEPGSSPPSGAPGRVKAENGGRVKRPRLRMKRADQADLDADGVRRVALERLVRTARRLGVAAVDEWHVRPAAGAHDDAAPPRHGPGPCGAAQAHAATGGLVFCSPDGQEFRSHREAVDAWFWRRAVAPHHWGLSPEAVEVLLAQFERTPHPRGAELLGMWREVVECEPGVTRAAVVEWVRAENRHRGWVPSLRAPRPVEQVCSCLRGCRGRGRGQVGGRGWDRGEDGLRLRRRGL